MQSWAGKEGFILSVCPSHFHRLFILPSGVHFRPVLAGIVEESILIVRPNHFHLLFILLSEVHFRAVLAGIAEESILIVSVSEPLPSSFPEDGVHVFLVSGRE